MAQLWFGIGEERVAKLVRRVVRRYHRQFSIFPDWKGQQDVQAEAMLGVTASLPNFKPQVSSPATFITMVAERRLLDKLKILRRRQHREEAYRGLQIDAEGRRPDEGVLEWVETLYAFTKRRMALRKASQKHAMSRNAAHSTLAQAIVIVALQTKLGLSYREMGPWLIEHGTVLMVLEFKAPPSRSTLSDMHQRVRHRSLRPPSNSSSNDRLNRTPVCPAIRQDPQRRYEHLLVA